MGRVDRFLRLRARFFAVLCVAQVPIAFLFPNVLSVEIATHFLPQQLLLFIVALAIWKMPANRVAYTAVAALVLLAVFGAPWLARRMETSDSPESDLQVISFNVRTSNEEKAPAAEWILSALSKKASNIVLLMETDESWIQAMTRLEEALPYKYLHPRPDNFGMAVYSSEPIDRAEFESLEDACAVPQFSGTVHLAKSAVRILGVHPLPPVPGNFAYRNDCIKKIEKTAISEKTPAIVMGDLNCSPWSSWFPRRLEDSFPFLVRRHTWSTLGGIVSTSIDHVLFTPPLAAVSRRIGPDLGSDHRPVIVGLTVSSGR